MHGHAPSATDRRTRRRRTTAGAAAVLALGLVLAACGFATTADLDDAKVTHDTAVLRGTAYDTVAGPITHWFEYGETDLYGSSTPVESATTTGPGVGVPVQATATGLDPSTTYHFRLCVKGGDGYGICSTDRTFTTDAPPPPADCFATFPGPTPYAVADGARAELAVDCAPITGPITHVCFEFTFGDDPLDPGEALTIHIPGESGFGFMNVLSFPLTDRTSCSVRPTVADEFRDGDAAFAIQLDAGTTVTIDQLRVYTYAVPAS